MAQPTIPGTPPLAELTGNLPFPYLTAPYDFTSLKYPQDIGHDIFQGHYINFYINVHRASDYYKGTSFTYGGAPSTYVALDENGSPTTSWGAAAQRMAYNRISQAISLYIPDTMQTSQNIEWENSSLLQLGEQMAKGATNSKGAGISSGGSSLKAKAMNALRSTSAFIGKAAEIGGNVGSIAGFAMNPQLLVLFRGINPRTFQYEFYFTPRNEDESNSVKNIIRAFRFHSHPEANLLAGAFFTAPSTFDIEFIHRGQRNTNIHQIKTCVLTNYTLDYAPYGWSTYKDGMPVQTRMVLTFQETDLIQKSDIEKGY